LYSQGILPVYEGNGLRWKARNKFLPITRRDMVLGSQNHDVPKDMLPLGTRSGKRLLADVELHFPHEASPICLAEVGEGSSRPRTTT
jgi:hypothetical protein